VTFLAWWEALLFPASPTISPLADLQPGPGSCAPLVPTPCLAFWASIFDGPGRGRVFHGLCWVTDRKHFSPGSDGFGLALASGQVLLGWYVFISKLGSESRWN